eukprot:TRINITY_DN3915_c0_g1_i1.p1 TRINITY_DN3915_c0_g1~~TRINITY_DN3915_c0_g1_i1.p1  ORF type:complete len:199 (-),score=27.77 TRINITY_DN3915_c0_g1_i1:45-641(-)
MMRELAVIFLVCLAPFVFSDQALYANSIIYYAPKCKTGAVSEFGSFAVGKCLQNGFLLSEKGSDLVETQYENPDCTGSVLKTDTTATNTCEEEGSGSIEVWVGPLERQALVDSVLLSIYPDESCTNKTQLIITTYTYDCVNNTDTSYLFHCTDGVPLQRQCDGLGCVQGCVDYQIPETCQSVSGSTVFRSISCTPSFF